MTGKHQGITMKEGDYAPLRLHKGGSILAAYQQETKGKYMESFCIVKRKSDDWHISSFLHSFCKSLINILPQSHHDLMTTSHSPFHHPFSSANAQFSPFKIRFSPLSLSHHSGQSRCNQHVRARPRLVTAS